MDVNSNYILDDQAHRQVKTLGISLIVLSLVMIFSNSMGIISFNIISKSFLPPPDDYVIKSSAQKLFFIILSNYLSLCVFFIFLGVLLLIGAINILRHKKWANRYLIIVASIYPIMIWTCLIVTSFVIIKGDEPLFFIFFLFVIGLLISIPFILLIRFLNKRGIKEIFN